MQAQEFSTKEMLPKATSGGLHKGFPALCSEGQATSLPEEEEVVCAGWVVNIESSGRRVR